MKKVLNDMVTWIRETCTDEKGNPSSNRQAAFASLAALIVFSATGSPDYVVNAFVSLTGALFIGTQVPKLKSGVKGSAIKETEKESEAIH